MSEDWKYFKWKKDLKYHWDLYRFTGINGKDYINFQKYSYKENEWVGPMENPTIEMNDTYITKLEVFKIISNGGKLNE